ncbi:MAG: BON domain-containing protein [Paralcaligenes sp.]
MSTSKRYTHVLITIAAAFALTACVVRPNEPGTHQYSNITPESGQANVSTGPFYYRGSESSMAPINNDATINANVVQAISRVPATAATNIQVTSYNGVVTLRGTADSQLVAQNDVQAARQVPGVQRVDYDIRVLGR